MYKLLFLFFSGLIGTASGQKNSLAQTLNDACTCFGGVGWESMEIPAMERAIDSCTARALVYNLSALMNEKLIDLNDQQQIQQFATQLGQQLYTDCKAYQNYWNARANSQLRVRQAKMPSIIGTIERVERALDGNQQIYWLRLPTMQLLPFYWIREFEGAADFLAAYPSQEGQRVRLLWEETSLYSPAQQRYQNLREIRAIQALDPVPETVPIPKDWARAQKQQAKIYKKHKQKLEIKKAKAQLKAAKAAK
jgi:hypothetical protein